ncbi:hypothetical protein W97_03402 [Coniosporium apollinis CBS 100218]|uniref:Glucose-methanol-choline oxidoreductase C-terminal domain-containing protein n=1 Tax=Coniosporium apollinis (strain CBS 100218) TaxID=1168221 RepID=R7YQJ5_CONA1|nr:uncharacterized protein W97_03402 [Coniosporium apollinis CBS 100218]EON64172.1 hypothetical protein W97_03402 [Coniosporium apollinis CBS 100218]
MFIIKFETDAIVPNAVVVLRTATDLWMNRNGEYKDGAWQFVLDEDTFGNGIQFKFVVLPNRWQLGGDLYAGPQNNGAVLTYTDAQVNFPDNNPVLVTENGVVAQRLLQRSVMNLSPATEYDVIVVGSGMGGGMLAAALADESASVLVLEAGPLLFPTHVGNLPRRLQIGKFQKHVWSLWEDFKVVNYTNINGSQYQGAQGFNLGGRSLFWGSLIPPLAAWELKDFPKDVRDYILDPSNEGGYAKATRAFNADKPASAYQANARNYLDSVIQGWTALDAPVAVEYTGATEWSVPAGIFSTSDLLIEDVLAQGLPVPGAPARQPLIVNLNHAVQTVLLDGNRATGVRCFDTLAQKQRDYKAKKVVLCAGTLESPKIALQSNLKDSNNMIGQGITDHAIQFRHFVVPANHPQASATKSAKMLLTHPGATEEEHAFDIVVELNSQLNQGRYVDPDHLATDAGIHKGAMLCEIVFQYYSPLLPGNEVTLAGNDSANPVNVHVMPATPAQKLLDEANDIAKQVFQAFNAQPIDGEEPLVRNGKAVLYTAAIGGVAHEVGTLRMADDEKGVLDADLKFLEYENLYACDNSVFPVSPAGNPSLTLAALALRLAKHLTKP